MIWNYVNEKRLKLYTDIRQIVCLLKLNEKLLASANRFNSIKIWDISSFSNDYLRSLNEFDGIFCLLKLNESQMVSGGNGSLIKVWDFTSYECLKVINGHTKTVCCLLKLNSFQIISLSKENSIRVWDLF